MLNELVADADLFFLIAIRVIALIETAPLLSGDGIPQVAKIALGGLAAATVFPGVMASGYVVPDTIALYVAVAGGEALIGIIMGFFISAVFAAFTTAGQFYSLQMGFGASEVYDPLAQIEIPLVGQFLNLIAMFIFVSTQGFQKLFLTGVYRSFKSMRVQDLLSNREDYFGYVVGSVGLLFQNALVLSFPILGTLFLVSLTMGLFSRAAPRSTSCRRASRYPSWWRSS